MSSGLLAPQVRLRELLGTTLANPDSDVLVRLAHFLCDVHLGLPELTEEAWVEVIDQPGLIYDVLTAAMTHLMETDQEVESFALAQRWKTPLFARLTIDELQQTTAGAERESLLPFFDAMDRLKAGVRQLAVAPTAESLADTIVQINDASAAVSNALDQRSLHDPTQAWRLGRVVLPDELIDALPERGGAVALVDLFSSSSGMFVHLVGRDRNRVVVKARITPFPLHEVIEWGDIYRNYVIEQVDPERASEALDGVCTVLHDRLWCKLAQFLGGHGYGQIILIPDAWTRGLPHHLAKVCGDEVTVPSDVPVVERERVADLFPIEFAPSVQSVALTQWQLRPRDVHKFVLAADPNDDLPGAAWTAVSIASRLAESLDFVPLVGEACMKTAFLAEMVEAGLVTFAGHGDYCTTRPIDSYLRFSDAQLTLGDVVAGAVGGSGAVQVLSCCELGIGTPGETMRGFAFPGALLAAGSPAVVAALWEMEDVSFGYLTDRFIEYLAHPGYRPAAALFRAMNDVKSWGRADVAAHIREMLAWMEAEGRATRSPAEYLRVSEMLAWVVDEANEHPFADPMYWGGAVVFGSGWSSASGSAPSEGSASIQRQMEVMLSDKPQQVRELIDAGEMQAAYDELEEWLGWAHGNERIVPLVLQAQLMEAAGLDRTGLINMYRRVQLLSSAHKDESKASYAGAQALGLMIT